MINLPFSVIRADQLAQRELWHSTLFLRWQVYYACSCTHDFSLSNVYTCVQHVGPPYEKWVCPVSFSFSINSYSIVFFCEIWCVAILARELLYLIQWLVLWRSVVVGRFCSSSILCVCVLVWLLAVTYFDVKGHLCINVKRMMGTSFCICGVSFCCLGLHFFVWGNFRMQFAKADKVMQDSQLSCP